MPEPASACSVRVESKTAVKPVWARTSAGMPTRPSGLVEHHLDRLVAHQGVDHRAGAQPLGHERGGSGQGAVDRRGELRGAGGLAEGVDHLDGRLRLGVDQVEGLAVVAGEVGEVVHGLGDVVDRARRWCRRGRCRPAAARPAAGRASPSSAGRSSRGRRSCPSRRSGSAPPRSRAGRRARPRRAGSPRRARSARTRTSCGGRARAGAGPRRTSSRRSGPGTHRRPRPRTSGGSSRRPGRRRARRRGGCRRRSSSRWWRRRRSCRRSRRGGRSGRSTPACSATQASSTPRPGADRSPTTGTTRLEPHRRMSVSSRPIEPDRHRTKMSPSRWSTSSWTR